MTIFFASMAHLFSEHASQAVSRDSEAALIPLEKRAQKKDAPLKQNAPQPARIFTGADTKDGLLFNPCFSSAQQDGNTTISEQPIAIPMKWAIGCYMEQARVRF